MTNVRYLNYILKIIIIITLSHTIIYRSIIFLVLIYIDLKIERYSGSYVGNVPANSRLKIPAINLEDGPQVCIIIYMLD